MSALAYQRTALPAGAEGFLVKKILGVDFWPTLLRIGKMGQGQPRRWARAAGRFIRTLEPAVEVGAAQMRIEKFSEGGRE